MVKDTNTREKVTLSKKQVKELEELADHYNMSKSALIGFAVSALLSYKVGDIIGAWILSKLEEKLNDTK